MPLLLGNWNKRFVFVGKLFYFVGKTGTNHLFLLGSKTNKNAPKTNGLFSFFQQTRKSGSTFVGKSSQQMFKNDKPFVFVGKLSKNRTNHLFLLGNSTLNKNQQITNHLSLWIFVGKLEPNILFCWETGPGICLCWETGHFVHFSRFVQGTSQQIQRNGSNGTRHLCLLGNWLGKPWTNDLSLLGSAKNKCGKEQIPSQKTHGLSLLGNGNQSSGFVGKREQMICFCWEDIWTKPWAKCINSICFCWENLEQKCQSTNHLCLLGNWPENELTICFCWEEKWTKLRKPNKPFVFVGKRLGRNRTKMSK